MVNLGVSKRVGIATDHGGFGLKEKLVAQLRAAGYEVVDFGAHGLNVDDDYPDFVIPLAKAVAAEQVERGIAICGSGFGASVCANKVPRICAGLVHDHFSARQGGRGRSHEHHLHGRPDL
jgi:ribose 5-phosphate isomerase B